jgi:hypothetical protein
MYGTDALVGAWVTTTDVEALSTLTPTGQPPVHQVASVPDLVHAVTVALNA